MSSTSQTFSELKFNTSTTPDTVTCQEKETSGSTINNLNQRTHTALLKRIGID